MLDNTNSRNIGKLRPNNMIFNYSDLFNSQSEERKKILRAILNEYLNQDFAKLKDTNAYKLQSVVALGYSPVATHRVFGGNKKLYLDLMNEFEKILFKEDK